MIAVDPLYGYKATVGYQGEPTAYVAPAYSPPAQPAQTYYKPTEYAAPRHESPPPPAYTPSQPAYTPSQPAYTPQTPAYTPPQPAYSPPQPAYTPPPPAYTPSQPRYDPLGFRPHYSDYSAAYAYGPGPQHQPPSDYTYAAAQPAEPPSDYSFAYAAPQPRPYSPYNGFAGTSARPAGVVNEPAAPTAQEAPPPPIAQPTNAFRGFAAPVTTTPAPETTTAAPLEEIVIKGGTEEKTKKFKLGCPKRNLFCVEFLKHLIMRAKKGAVLHDSAPFFHNDL